MADIFISYRRADSADYTGRLYTDLKDLYGPGRVFMDTEGIKGGSHFAEVLEDRLQAAKIILVIIGDKWLSLTEKDDQGNDIRRLDNPNDFVRREVEAALARNDEAIVIPVLKDGVYMPGSADLPDSMQELAYCNAISIGHHKWKYDLVQLTDLLDQHVRRQKKPSDNLTSKLKWIGVGAALLIALAVIITMFADTDEQDPNDVTAKEQHKQDAAHSRFVIVNRFDKPNPAVDYARNNVNYDDYFTAVYYTDQGEYVVTVGFFKQDEIGRMIDDLSNDHNFKIEVKDATIIEERQWIKLIADGKVVENEADDDGSDDAYADSPDPSADEDESRPDDDGYTYTDSRDQTDDADSYYTVEEPTQTIIDETVTGSESMDEAQRRFDARVEDFDRQYEETEKRIEEVGRQIDRQRRAMSSQMKKRRTKDSLLRLIRKK